jgi:hypothetical protein
VTPAMSQSWKELCAVLLIGVVAVLTPVPAVAHDHWGSITATSTLPHGVGVLVWGDQDNAVAARFVPEPATFGLVLVGVTLLRPAIRKRRPPR